MGEQEPLPNSCARTPQQAKEYRAAMGLPFSFPDGNHRGHRGAASTMLDRLFHTVAMQPSPPWPLPQFSALSVCGDDVRSLDLQGADHFCIPHSITQEIWDLFL